MRFSSHALNLASIILTMCMIVSCDAQNNKESNSPVQAKKPEIVRIENYKATSIAAMAFRSLMDVENIDKYSSSSGSENYQQPDEYYVINFQEKGLPHFIAHTLIDGKIIYMQKLFPKGEPIKPLLTENGAAKLAVDFVFNRLQSTKDQYKVTKIEQEKVSKGIDAYWMVTLDVNPEFNKNNKAPKSLLIKIHPKTQEVMVIEYHY
ncbi:MAG: hypothetical protein JNK41_11640 [Saprospiraceae bacterium]|jgi:hypothetical protein|nr:hypothetical protein [Saprospiraceae bacterium]